ncbi:MAG: hypothetical protein AAFN77_06980 [Planctomycetota bacterium]
MLKNGLFVLSMVGICVLFTPMEDCCAQRDRQQEGKQKQDRPRRSRSDNAPKVGDDAPDFTLKSLDGESETKLSSFKDSKPVVLFFGSYT